MSSYLAVVNARFRTLLQYRAAAWAGFGTQLFWGLMRVMIFSAFYQSSTAAQPMSLEQVITYVWLGQAMLAMLPWNIDTDIQALIRSGGVAYELVRPLDLYGLWYARTVAMRSAQTCLRSVPMFILAGLFFGLQAPDSWASAGAFALSLGAALLLAASLSTLMAISLLWTISGQGVARLLMAGAIVFTGVLVPLPLFPDWAQGIVNALPFRGVADIPFRLYSGHIPANQIGWMLAHQLGWTAALVLIGRWVLSRGTRRLVVQGG